LTYCKILSNTKLPRTTGRQYYSNKELDTVWMEVDPICLRHKTSNWLEELRKSRSAVSGQVVIRLTFLHGTSHIQHWS